MATARPKATACLVPQRAKQPLTRSCASVSCVCLVCLCLVCVLWPSRPSIKVGELLRDKKVQELFHFYHDALKQVRVRVRVRAYATLIWSWRHVSVAKGQPCLTCYHDALKQVGTPIAA